MTRVAIAVAAVSLLLVSGAGAWSHVSRAALEPGTITLKGHTGRQGVWKTALSIKLIRVKLLSFSICAVRNYHASNTFECGTTASRIPEGATLRLEQHPVAKALARADSPGWGMLGVSSTDKLGAVLSNELTNDKYGTYTYRVTLRDSSGKVLASSNKLTVTWHK